MTPIQLDQSVFQPACSSTRTKLNITVNSAATIIEQRVVLNVDSTYLLSSEECLT